MVWMNPLIERLENKETGEFTRGTSLRKEIIRKRLAIENNAHMSNLLSSCKEIGFDRFIEEDDDAFGE